MSGTPIAKMVREMIARGVDPDVIELAVATAEQASRVEIPRNSADESAERRREKDRLRKREAKANPQNSAENPQNSNSAIYLSLSKNSEEQERKKERAKPKRNSAGSRLPEDWRPSAEHYRFAAESGQSRHWVDQQFEDMRIWARSNEHRAVARKSDWNLTFHGWLRRSTKPPPGPPGRPPQKSFADIAHDLQQKINGHDHSSHEPSFDLGGGPVIDADAFHRS